MDNFFEDLRVMYEMAYRAEGYDDVEALIVDEDADCKNDSRLKALVEQGYLFVDETLFGEGPECLGKVVIFVKGEKH